VSTALAPAVAEARDHVRGSAGPTLLIFGDYECPYTRMAYRSVQSLEARGFSSACFRHFPLVEIHPHALAAAESDDLRARTHAPLVADDVDSADASRVTGTPSFFVNGRRHEGAYDIETLSKLVREALATDPVCARPSLSSL
jgi:protein-disulfide isomerase